MLENNVEFRATDFSQVHQTNSIFKQFYKAFNYNKDDNYPATTKMVLKSSSSLDFQLDCQFKSDEEFHVGSNNIQTVNMAMISDTIYGGSIKNDNETVIAEWATLPRKYMQVTSNPN